MDGSNHVYFSNRSASFLSLNNSVKALEDADKCIELKPDWAKGFSRKGAALFHMRKMTEAKAAYADGLKLDSSNEMLKSGLQDVETAMQRTVMRSLGIDGNESDESSDEEDGKAAEADKGAADSGADPDALLGAFFSEVESILPDAHTPKVRGCTERDMGADVVARSS